MVFVRTQIEDNIKGKYIPNCPTDTTYYSIGRKGGMLPLSVPIDSTQEQLADSGACLTFEYAQEWDHEPVTDEVGLLPFTDASGTWIRPDSEYIVFLGLGSSGKRMDSAFFTLKPLGNLRLFRWNVSDT
jgi:hypothetical protein